ncbi:MAG: T9SS type A sorting domain-containing protein [Bacteroidales bacterium]|nr:T9SS type A sorting domain-containing protein [Bacteroidales bacterium]
MKIFVITFAAFLICSPVFLFGQEKAPVAEDDYYNAFSLRTDTIHVLDNDYSYNEHPLKLYQVLSPSHGEMYWDDSLIYYTPNMYFAGIDTIKYWIIDTENMLFSEFALVYLQVENKSFDTLKINNIHCRINVCGVQFWDMENLSETMFEVPANSGVNAIFSLSLWMGDLNQNYDFHFAGDTWRYGEDYFPGPVMNSTAYTTEYDINWNRVWMLYQTDIDYHRAHWQDAGYEMIENILYWPAKSNPEFAPFYDININGVYDPESGDFPLIKGDQAIYYIYNDDRSVHTQSWGERIGAEIHTMYYAFDRPDDSTLNNTVFASYKIFNKSENDYHDYYLGFFNDIDIGCPNDDYLGTDTVLNSLYGYNSMPYDCSYQYPNNYGDYPPAISLTALNFNITSTMSFYGIWPDPTTTPTFFREYYNYFQAIWRDSTHLTIGGQGYGGTESTMFVYPGNPITGEGWSEVSANNESYDKKGLVSVGPYNFNAGESIELEFAMVFARDYSGGDFAHLNSVGLLKNRITQLIDYYNNSFGVEELQAPQMEFEIYPNPSNNFIIVKTTNNQKNLKYSIYNILGETLMSGIIKNTNQAQINLEKLNNGIYFIRISDGKTFATRKIIKQ